MLCSYIFRYVAISAIAYSRNGIGHNLSLQTLNILTVLLEYIDTIITNS